MSHNLINLDLLSTYCKDYSGPPGALEVTSHINNALMLVMGQYRNLSFHAISIQYRYITSK